MVGKLKVAVSYILAILLTFSSCSLSIAEGSATQALSSKIGQVSIKKNSQIELTNVQMIPSNNQQSLSFTINVVNNESTPISFYDYWVKVKLNNGAVIPAKVFGNNAAKDDEIAPNTTKSYTFYSVVNRSVKYSDISIQILQWDFSQPEFYRILGTIKIPASYDPVRADRSLLVDNTKLSVDFKDIRISKVNEEKKIDIKMELYNEGIRSVTIPAYKYYLVTGDNYIYELTVQNKDAVQVRPKSKNKVELKTYIPETVDIKTAKLIITLYEDQTKIEIPIKSFSIDLNKPVSSETTSAVGTEKTVFIDDKEYLIKLDSVQQLPWEDQNIISAMITLTNKSNEAVPIPQLGGTFYLDGIAIADDKTKVINIDGGIGLPEASKIRLSVYVKVPYAYKYSTVKLELYNSVKDGNDTVKEELLTYSVPKTAFKAFTNVNLDKDLVTSTTGKAVSYKIKSLSSYQNNNTSIYDVLLEVENKELRSTTLPKLIGYLKSSNSTLYPVEITEVKDKINPSGKVLLSLYAKIPSWANTNDLRLLLGELLPENEAYLSAAEFRLPVDTAQINNAEMKNMEIYPYKISINNIAIDLTSDATVNFQYTLTKSSEYESTPEGHSLVMELVDGEIAYSKEYKFESDLKLGTNLQTMVASMGIDNPNIKISNIDGFTINIYDQFEGHKKLLASRKVYAIFIK